MQSCISRMKYLSISNIDVCQVYMLSFSLLSLAIFQVTQLGCYHLKQFEKKLFANLNSYLKICHVYFILHVVFQIFEAIVSLGIFIIIMIRNHNKPSPCGGNYTILKFIDCNRSRENEEDHQNAQNVPMWNLKIVFFSGNKADIFITL